MSHFHRFQNFRCFLLVDRREVCKSATRRKDEKRKEHVPNKQELNSHVAIEHFVKYRTKRVLQSVMSRFETRVTHVRKLI